MIDAVLLFGVMNVLFEFILLSMVPPKHRLRLLGNRNSQALLHFACLLINLMIHWGTLIGTMSGIFSFICSIGTVAVARFVFGFIEHDRHYKVGLVKYQYKELV